MSPIDYPPTNDDTNTVAFIDLIDTALRERKRLVATQIHALDMGIAPDDLRHYVAGTLVSSQRHEIETSLLSNTWAFHYVVDLVKAARANVSSGDIGTQ